MIEYTEKALSIRRALKAMDTSILPLIVYEAARDGLASAIADIGEQLDLNKLSMEIREQNPDVPWSDIKRYRDKHNHWYQDLNHELVEAISDDYLSELYDRLLEIRHDIETTLSEM